MIYTSDQIRDITEASIRNRYSETIDQIFEECKTAASEMKYETILYGIHINDKLKMYLETLGYKIRKNCDSINYTISW